MENRGYKFIRMKKIFSTFFGLFLMVAIMISYLFPCVKFDKICAHAVEGLGESVENQFDIIGINPNRYDNATIEEISPFDINLKEMMPGSSITPTADKYGQITGSTFLVNSFSLTEDESIYLWVYLFEIETFELTFKIGDGAGSAFMWYFDSSIVQSFGQIAGSGWKLLELKTTDAEIAQGTSDIYSLTFSTFSVSYETSIEENIEDYFATTDDRLSIYHVYKASSNSKSSYSGKIDEVSKAYCEFNDDFLANIQVYRDDEIIFTNPESMFNHLVVGKYYYSDLKNTADYTWEINISNPNGGTVKLDFGDSFCFTQQGYHTINIKLYEKNTLLNQPIGNMKRMILNMSKDVFCEELSLGKFVVSSNYEINNNETVLIEFKIASGINISGDFNISLSNNKAEIVSQYEEDGILRIKVKGLKAGSTKMTIKANASSDHNDSEQEYSSEIKIYILSTTEVEDISMPILWVVFGLFCAYFIGFLINSLVKARKNDVK